MKMETICPECDGSGEVEVYLNNGDIDDVYLDMQPCPHCEKGLVRIESGE